MNTGAEAVETAIKVARKWGYEIKGIPTDRAKIIVAADNFHGRTTTVVSFSTDPDAREGFGPFTPGFEIVPFGDTEALAAAIDEHTAAVLIEPIQGEAGIIIPPPGYLAAVRELCTRANVLFIADEIQAGLGRTGKTFAVEHAGVRPDMFILGKALGGGIVPVSAVVSSYAIMDVIRPGNHGSTFGGNPLAAAVGHAVVGLLETGEYQAQAAALGEQLSQRLRPLVGHGVNAVRTAGLWAGVDIDPKLMTGRQMCERLLDRGILAKDAHGATLRFAPPLVVTAADLDWMVDEFAAALT
jgi:ornithine--oxo-acid transaminase